MNENAEDVDFQRKKAILEAPHAGRNALFSLFSRHKEKGMLYP